MKILAVDQARHGAWSIFDYEEKKLLLYGVFDFGDKIDFELVLHKVETIVDELIVTHGIDAVFIEDIQMRKNAQAFKKLAWLQGVLINMFNCKGYVYTLISPSQWQGFCKARGRSEKEKKSKLAEIETKPGKKASKILSLQFVKENFGINTENDNLADAICIGHYVVNNIKIVNKG